MSLPGTGHILRRRLIAVAEAGAVRAAVADDYHEFALTLAHDGMRVTALSIDPIRVPWTSCSEAGGKLAELTGQPLVPRAVARLADIHPKQHCTHMFELACFAMGHAARVAAGGSARRQYDLSVPARVEGRTRAEAKRDGVTVLALDMVGDDIAAPYEGQNVRTMTSWADRNLDDDGFEALMVLRRALQLTRGRFAPGADMPRPGELMHIMSGACFTFQPQNADRGVAYGTNLRDFTDRPDALLPDFA